MASIARAAKDVSQRIKAEFHAEDLYLAYQVFDVESWSQILSDSTPDARWDASARKLCAALGMRHDRWAWVAAAKIALALKSGWVNQQGASASTLAALVPPPPGLGLPWSPASASTLGVASAGGSPWPSRGRRDAGGQRHRDLPHSL